MDPNNSMGQGSGAEIRDEIYSHVSDFCHEFDLEGKPKTEEDVCRPRFYRELAPVHVCSQMREEMKPLLFGKRALVLRKNGHAQGRAYAATPFVDIAEKYMGYWTTHVHKLPMSLRTPETVFEYQIDVDPSDPFLEPGQAIKQWAEGPRFATNIKKIIAAAGSTPLVISINYNFAKLGAFVSAGHHHMYDFTGSTNERASTTRSMCRKVYMSNHDCEMINFQLPTNDVKVARERITKAVAFRRRRLEEHRACGFCHIRLGLAKSLQGLEVAESNMLKVLAYLPSNGHKPRNLPRK